MPRAVESWTSVFTSRQTPPFVLGLSVSAPGRGPRQTSPKQNTLLHSGIQVYNQDKRHLLIVVAVYLSDKGMLMWTPKHGGRKVLVS